MCLWHEQLCYCLLRNAVWCALAQLCKQQLLQAMFDLSSQQADGVCFPVLQVLGDRSLKYKYVNPNLLFVAVGPDPAKPLPDEPAVTALVINSVSGAVLHSQVHADASGPVLGLVSEHWVVYSSIDLKTLRQQVSEAVLTGMHTPGATWRIPSTWYWMQQCSTQMHCQIVVAWKHCECVDARCNVFCSRQWAVIIIACAWHHMPTTCDSGSTSNQVKAGLLS